MKPESVKVMLNVRPPSNGACLWSLEKHRQTGGFDLCHPYFVLMILCFLVHPVATAAQEYVEITGEIEVTSYPNGNTNDPPSSSSPWRITFVCVSGPKAWIVEHDAESKWSFDGTNVYHRLGFPGNTPTVNIWESRDGHPMGYPGVNLAWLAFCSGSYLKREGRLIPLPDDILRHTPDRFAYTDKTETFTDEPGLPSRIDLFTSKSLYQASVDDFYGERLSGRRYEEYTRNVVSNLQDGILTFHYAVTESTNFLGWRLPTKFEYFQKGRDYVQNGRWYHRGVGKVSSLRPTEAPTSPFVAGEKRTIVDWRFRDAPSGVNALTYASTNAFASPTSDRALQEKFAKRIARMNQGR